MPKVVGVRLRYSKTLWFDPAGLEPKNGDLVLVSTERGTELGMVYHPIHEVESSSLPAELKPVLRIATDEDVARAVELSELEKDAFPTFVELIELNKLDMNPIDIEYVFSGEMMVFYFSADERIDFRGLVKDLASRFKQRIDMRQIGVRDEARRVGGIGHCGQELCCSRLGGEFAPVAVKMAKDQGLPLNPAKISGLCGRLMCCLRYEVEVYKDFNSRAPKRSALISTPRGEAKVVDRDALRELITLQFQKEEGGWENIPVALGSISCCKTSDKKGGCPCHISEEDFEAISPSDNSDLDLMIPIEPNYKSDRNGSDRSASAKTDRGSRSSRGEKSGRSERTGKSSKERSGNTPAPANKPGADSVDTQASKPKRSRRRSKPARDKKPASSPEQQSRPSRRPEANVNSTPGERIPRRRRRED